MLGRLRMLPSVPEASRVLEQLGSGRELGNAARSVADALRDVPRRPIALVDAVLGWVAAEAVRFRAAPPAPPARLRAGPVDFALVLLAAATVAALLV
jgi:hypothetical protein